jgi:ADP-heptose:LPS heptosyltransferase
MIEMRTRWKRRLAMAADRVLALSAPLLVSRGAPPVLPSHPRILLIRCDHIGDAVMATAVLGPLRRHLQPERLDVLAGPWAAAVFRTHPAVDEVIEYAAPWWGAARGLPRRARIGGWSRLPRIVWTLRSRHYDIAIDLRGDLRHILFFLALGNARERVSSDRTGGRRLLTRVWAHEPGLHQVEMNGAIVGLLGVQDTWRLELPVPKTIPAPLERELQSASGPNGFVVFALRGNKPNRTWPLDHAATVAYRAHAELGLGVVYAGGSADREYAAELRQRCATPLANLAGKTTLEELVAIFARAAACVTVDSGPMHLAAAASTPVVALFGPTDPRHFGPWTSRSRIVSLGAPCGCADLACSFTGGPGQCMARLTPDAVTEALRDLCRETQRSPVGSPPESNRASCA